MSDNGGMRALQVLGSILVAIVIVWVTVALVTAKIGPGPDGQEQRDLYELREDRREERQELREERREERRELLEDRRER